MSAKHKHKRVRERVKRDLYAGKPLSLIREEYRSVGEIYNAVNEVLDEMEEVIDAKRDEVTRLSAAVEDMKQKLTSVSAEHTELLKENDCLKEKIERNGQQLTKAAHRLENLEGQIKDRQTCLGELNSKIEDLTSKGVTLEIVQKIHAAEFKSGEDLLGRVRTTQDHARLQKAVDAVKTERTELEKTVRGLKDTVTDLQEEVKSAENRLDSLKDETAIYSTAVDVVKKLFRAGYSTEDIAHLRDGLKTMGIKGDPKTSLKRLVLALQRVKSLETLRKQIKEAEAELKATRRDLNAAKAEFASIRNTTLKNLEKTRKDAVAELKKTEDEVTAEMRRVLTELREDVKGWGEIQRNAGELHSDIENAKRFTAFMYEDKILEGLPVSFVSSVMSRLALWIAKKLPQVKRKPSSTEGGLSSYTEYDLADVAEFLFQALRQLAEA